MMLNSIARRSSSLATRQTTIQLATMPKTQKQRYINTYPRPTSPPFPDRSKTAGSPFTPHLPCLPPPTDPSPPSLPVRQNGKYIPEGWKATSHIIPAAYPRQWAESFGDLRREQGPHAGPSSIPPDESKEARGKRTLGEAKNQLRRRMNAKTANWEDVPEDKMPKSLYLAAERWVRTDRSSGKGEGEGVTLVMLHANGFHKEAWQPTIQTLLAKGAFSSSSSFGTTSTGALDSLYSATKGNGSLQVDEIWLLDDVHHAASMDLNEGRIGPLHSWVDGGRDIINLVEHVLPPSRTDEISNGAIMPWRKAPSRRKVVGIGHSVGGNALVHAAHARPDLFDALILVEPMTTFRSVQDPDTLNLDTPDLKGWPLLLSTLRRRSIWPSAKAHAEGVRNTGFFKTWHPAVWDLWLGHGIASHSGGGVQLATPPWAEAAIFAEISALREAYYKLPELKIPVGFVMSGDASMMAGEEDVRDMVWRPPKVKNERIMSAGHLVPQEKPEELADAIWRYLGSILPDLQTGGIPRAKL